jgi:hypothetical protein
LIILPFSSASARKGAKPSLHAACYSGELCASATPAEIEEAASVSDSIRRWIIKAVSPFCRPFAADTAGALLG